MLVFIIMLNSVGINVCIAFIIDACCVGFKFARLLTFGEAFCIVDLG